MATLTDSQQAVTTRCRMPQRLQLHKTATTDETFHILQPVTDTESQHLQPLRRHARDPTAHQQGACRALGWSVCKYIFSQNIPSFSSSTTDQTSGTPAIMVHAASCADPAKSASLECARSTASNRVDRQPGCQRDAAGIPARWAVKLAKPHRLATPGCGGHSLVSTPHS